MTTPSWKFFTKLMGLSTVNQSHMWKVQGCAVSRYRFGRSWIGTKFWLCIWFRRSRFWVSPLQKILFAYTKDTFCGSLDTEPVSCICIADPNFTSLSCDGNGRNTHFHRPIGRRSTVWDVRAGVQHKRRGHHAPPRTLVLRPFYREASQCYREILRHRHETSQ